jgi:ABC-type multidrug transport system ATPase subunit
MLRSAKSAPGSNLAFDHVALAKRGPTLALEVPPGTALAIMGPASSGKSALLAAVAGTKSPARGTVSRPNSVMVLDDEDWSRRETPTSLAREIIGKNANQRTTDALLALNLWEVRQKSLHSLGAAQRVAAQFLPAILANDALICVDHQLDHLDVPVGQSVWSAMLDRRRDGAIVAYSTHRPELGELADIVIVLKDEQIVFSGSPNELKRTAASTELEIFVEGANDIRAIADPFEIEVEETEHGLLMRTKEGQALAAKLLMEGYGSVKYVIQRPPTFAEALARLL